MIKQAERRKPNLLSAGVLVVRGNIATSTTAYHHPVLQSAYITRPSQGMRRQIETTAVLWICTSAFMAHACTSYVSCFIRTPFHYQLPCSCSRSCRCCRLAPVPRPKTNALQVVNLAPVDRAPVILHNATSVTYTIAGQSSVDVGAGMLLHWVAFLHDFILYMDHFQCCWLSTETAISKVQFCIDRQYKTTPFTAYKICKGEATQH